MAGVRLGESDVDTTGLGDNALRDGSNGDVCGRFRLELNLQNKNHNIKGIKNCTQYICILIYLRVKS